MGRESALRPRALIVEDEILIAPGLKEEMRALGMSTSTELVWHRGIPVASRRVRLAGYFHHSLY